MLDELLRRDDVLSFIHDIKNNFRYKDKDINKFSNHSYSVSNELALYIFYDALIKYSIILEDVYLFDEYLENLYKLYRKIDNYNDITIGINKIICKMVIIKLGIRDIHDDANRKEVIKYIYDRYISNGYFVHGFSTIYEKRIKSDGVIPEIYENYYQKMIEINRIFAKYNVINMIDKDFSDNRIYFTDDIVKGCYYSVYSPMYFYKFLFNEEYFNKYIDKDAYLADDYNVCIKPLKRFMGDSSFSDRDKKFVLNVVKEEWDFLHRVNKKISLLFVKRKKIYNSEKIRLTDYIDDTGNIFDIVDRLLSCKHNNVSYNDVLSCDDIEIVTLDDFYGNTENHSLVIDANYRNIDVLDTNSVNIKLSNAYGKASVLILLGSLFISFGVIFSIIMILRGR